MYGWYHAALERLILTKYGGDKWKEIKFIANCNVKNGEWAHYKNYTDEGTFALLEACCTVLRVNSDTMLENLGEYFMQFVRDEGYLTMLSVLGSDLREWLTNVNDLHVHLKSAMPDAKFPEYWCVDDDDAVPEFESMILHYYSQVSFVLVVLFY